MKYRLRRFVHRYHMAIAVALGAAVVASLSFAAGFVVGHEDLRSQILGALNSGGPDAVYGLLTEDRIHSAVTPSSVR